MVAGRVTRIMLVCAIALLGLGGSIAGAQTSSPTATTPHSTVATDTVKEAPLAEGVLQVQAAPDVAQGLAAIIVAVQLPPDTKLPAMVRIPVPTGASATWVGEIVGDDPTGDPERPYRTVQGTGGQVLEMTLEVTRSAQAEFTVPSVTSSGGKVTMNVNWVQATPSTSTEFSVRMPPGATQVQITPAPDGAPATNQLGEALYALPSKTMKPGETAAISVVYVAGTGQPATGSTSGGSNPPVFWLLVAALFVVLAILGFSLMSRRSRAE
jgi:hypothetical protein